MALAKLEGGFSPVVESESATRREGARIHQCALNLAGQTFLQNGPAEQA